LIEGRRGERGEGGRIGLIIHLHDLTIYVI
jgi:hypothetical protein